MTGPESENLLLPGQLFMVGLPGPVLDESTRRLIEKFRINNFIYFKRNVESREQLKRLSTDLRRACSQNGLAPPLISIDQEGGSVTRLPPPFTQFPDARVLAETEDPEESLGSYARVCAGELMEVGINYNLAPVLDVCEAGQGYFMERRSLGGEPGTVGRLGIHIIRTMQAEGVAACAKHFPGLGGAVADPHIRLPFVARTEQELRTQDLLPFKLAVGAGVASVMTSHTVYRNLDPDHPATLSKGILTGLLRNELAYDGVVITDDLEMGAIEREGDLGLAALKAFTAGADMLLICHSHEKVIDAVGKVGRTVAENLELHAKMLKSRQRIEAMRQIYAG